MRSSPLLLVALAVALLAACGPQRDLRSGPPPAAFQPERFPDLPMPPGFIPKAGEDQLAVSYADGALRRYHVVLVQATEDGLEGEELEEWYRSRLATRGWVLAEDAWPKRQRWTRQGPTGVDEQLLLETGRADRRTIIRLVLTPAEA